MFHPKCVGLQTIKNFNTDFYCSSCKEEEEKGSSPIICITIEKTDPSDLSSLTDFKIKKLKIPEQKNEKEKKLNFEIEKNRNSLKDLKEPRIEEKLKKKKESQEHENFKIKKPLVFKKYKAKFMEVYPLMKKNKLNRKNSYYINVD